MKLSFNPQIQRKGFTLIELLTVVAIIVVLMALTVGLSRFALERANKSKARTQIALIGSKLEEYKADFGEFPPGTGARQSSNQLFIALYDQPLQNGTKIYMPEFDPRASNQFKIKERLILDPFRHKKPYYYLRGVDANGEQNGSAFNPDFDLWSLGPNGKGRGDGGNTEKETADDIANYE